MSGWTRASELDRTLRCVGSSVIPGSRLVSDGVRKAGAWGTFVHYWKETGTLIDSDDFEYSESFAKTFNKKWDIIGSNELRETLWPSDGQHEVSFSYSCETQAVAKYEDLTGSDKWKDSHTTEYVCGTSDYVSELNGLLWIDDLKTGALFDTPPDRSLQLYYYAMCASLWRYGELRDSVVSITRWPKYPLSVLPERKHGYLPAERIDRFQKLLQDSYEKYLEGYDLDSFNINDGCIWCPAREKCPILV